MKILVFGGKGQLGTHLVNEASSAGHSTIAMDRDDADFSNPQSIEKAICENNPDIVINCCAYTAVDKAEEETELADAVNHLGVLALAKATGQRSIPVIHISTDYVYSGQSEAPYVETAATAPLSVYGKTKLAGDLALADNNPKHVILRTSWVFGEFGNNFVKTMLRLAETRDELNVVADQKGKPTYTGDIVAAILATIKKIQAGDINWGIYHCSSAGETTWCEFAQAIFEQAKAKGLIDKTMNVHPIPTSQYPTPAPRPLYSVLDTGKLEAELNMTLPNWQLGLEKLLDYLQTENG
ncbi:dTDP-4-dehydrorhamnose reductase [Sessilibacter corallicola]|uniref:dTDP-4-dehydrorhamnose reductase n=1 Tax=Sessilibacter corallicola TaxID=2904075 RepID=A0ABQ0ADS4_9GAMM